MGAGFDRKRMRLHNRASAFRMIQRLGPLSRKELAQRLSLTPAALTRIAGDLVRTGVVNEAIEARLDRDLPRSRLTLNPDWGCAITLSLMRNLCAGVVDFAGRLKHSEALASNSLDVRGNREDFETAARDVVKRLLKKHARGNVLGVGIVSAGYVAPDGVVRDSAYLPAPDLDMRRVLAPITSLPITTEEESRSLLLTRLFRSDLSEQESLVTLISRVDGFGGPQAVYIKGRLLDGKDGMAGLPGWRLGAASGAENVQPGIERFGGEAEFVRRVLARDTVVQPLFERVIRNCACRVALAVNILNPHRVFLYSPYADLGEEFLGRLRDLVRQATEPLAFENTELILSGRRSDEERLTAAATPILSHALDDGGFDQQAIAPRRGRSE